MAFVTSDLFRNLGIGFLLGAFAVVIANPALVAALV